MTDIEQAQLVLTEAQEIMKKLGLPCLMVIGIPEEGKVVSFAGGLSDPRNRALVAASAMSIISKAQKTAVIAKAPNGMKFPPSPAKPGV